MKKKISKYENSFIYDKPITYKNIIIYPVLVRDYLYFYSYAECFTLDKNSSKDPKVISMTYIDYLYSMQTDENPYLAYFVQLMRIVTRKEDLIIQFAKNEKGKIIFFIDGVEYNHSDFEEIKEIISEYNYVDLPNEMIQKEIRDNMNEARRLRSKVNGLKMASLEDQIVCVLISSSLSFEDIYNLPIRKFVKILERADAALHYKIYLSASMSGFVEFKDKSFIKHWRADLNSDKLDLVPLEQIQGTVSGKNAKTRNNKRRK